LDSALRKPDAIREELANATTLDTQPRRRVKGYVSRGQGQNADTPWVDALAVRDGRLVEVGSEEAARAAVGADASVIDLQGKMVMPGRMDVHSHFVLAGRAELYEVNFLPTASLDQIIESVRGAAKDRPQDRWFVGGIWGSTLLDQLPTRRAFV
ncbi:amidohydrolase family protein, partial [Pseudomonas sp. DSP3-2-2]|uniref:amidohydrolase family protein n=1 Tax=unclassified Pseudomonas TaxID=196821 RepID=UPI003CEC36EE